LRTDVTQKLGQIRPMSSEEQSQLIEQMRQQQMAAAAAADQGVARATSDATGAGASPREGFVEDDPTTWGSPGRTPEPCLGRNLYVSAATS